MAENNAQRSMKKAFRILRVVCRNLTSNHPHRQNDDAVRHLDNSVAEFNPAILFMSLAGDGAPVPPSGTQFSSMLSDYLKHFSVVESSKGFIVGGTVRVCHFKKSGKYCKEYHGREGILGGHTRAFVTMSFAPHDGFTLRKANANVHSAYSFWHQ